MIDFSNVKELSIGGRSVKELWIGGKKVWDMGGEYSYGGLTFTATQANSTVAMAKDSSAPTISLEYTTDGSTWNPFIVGTTTVTLANVGDKVGIKATTTNGKFNTTYNLASNYFVMTGVIQPSGNINSLLNQDFESVTSIPDSCWGYLFKNCKAIVDASELKLPAPTVENFGYGWMFDGCTNLVKGPEVFATTIGTRYGIDHFFNNCTSLQEIKIHYTGSFGGERFDGWVTNVPRGGTIYYNGSDRSTGANAIPAGWTIQTF